MPAWPKPSKRRKSRAAVSRDQVNEARDGIYMRDGYRCVVDGSLWAMRHPCRYGLTIQHAIGKGIGGSALFDSPILLRTMCLAHNTDQPASAEFARLCLLMGWSLERHRVGVDPHRVPVRYPDGCDYFLDNNFQKHLISRSTAAEIRAELYPELT